MIHLVWLINSLIILLVVGIIGYKHVSCSRLYLVAMINKLWSYRSLISFRFQDFSISNVYFIDLCLTTDSTDFDNSGTESTNYPTHLFIY